MSLRWVTLDSKLPVKENLVDGQTISCGCYPSYNAAVRLYRTTVVGGREGEGGGNFNLLIYRLASTSL